MNSVENNISQIKKSIKKLLMISSSIISSNVFEENVNISGYLINSNVQLTLLLNENNAIKFFKKLKEFILTDKGCYYIVNLLLSFPKARANNIIKFNNDFECAYTLKYSIYSNSILETINSQYKFLFYLDSGNKKDNEEVLKYWMKRKLFDEDLNVFFRIQNEKTCEISLQIMTKQDYTLDIYDVIKNTDIRNFIIDILKENEELRGKIDVCLRKFLGNTFTLF